MSDDGISRDRFQCKYFPKVHTSRSAIKIWANFEWSVHLRCSERSVLQYLLFVVQMCDCQVQ